MHSPPVPLCSVLILMTDNSKRTSNLILLLAIAQVTTMSWKFRVLQNFSFFYFFLSNYSNCEKQCFCYPDEIWKCTSVNHNHNTVNNASLECPKYRDHICVQLACKALAKIINANEVQFYTTSWEYWQRMEQLQRPWPILKFWKSRNISVEIQVVILTKNLCFFENKYWTDT